MTRLGLQDMQKWVNILSSSKQFKLVRSIYKFCTVDCPPLFIVERDVLAEFRAQYITNYE